MPEGEVNRLVQEIVRGLTAQGVDLVTAASTAAQAVVQGGGYTKKSKPRLPKINHSLTLPKLNISRTLKPEDFNKDGQTFLDWERSLESELRAAQLLKVLKEGPPADMVTEEGEWWTQADATIYNALLKSIPDRLLAKAHMMAGRVTSSKDVLEMVRTIQYKPTPFVEFQLQDELNYFRPKEDEHMEEYLGRAEVLMQKFANYGVRVAEERISMAVVKGLADDWILTIQKLGENTQEWKWDHVSKILLNEDLLRRSYGRGSSMLFPPLGMRKKNHGRGLVVSDTPQGLTPVRTNFVHGKTSYPHSPGRNSSPRRDASPGRTPKFRENGEEYKTGEFMQCLHCRKWGHGWKECASRSESWNPRPEDWDDVLEAQRNAKVGQSRRGRSHRGDTSPRSPRSGPPTPRSNASPRSSRSPRVSFHNANGRERGRESPRSPPHQK
jgi:hypothetical protein